MAITDVIERELVVAGTSMAAAFNSPWIDVRYHNRGALQMVWTGADAVDAILVPQASLNKVDWCDLASGSLIEKVDEPAANAMYEFTDMGFSYFRLRFDPASNTAGTMQAIIILKRDRGYGVP